MTLHGAPWQNNQTPPPLQPPPPKSAADEVEKWVTLIDGLVDRTLPKLQRMGPGIQQFLSTIQDIRSGTPRSDPNTIEGSKPAISADDLYSMAFGLLNKLPEILGKPEADIKIDDVRTALRDNRDLVIAIIKQKLNG